VANNFRSSRCRRLNGSSIPVSGQHTAGLLIRIWIKLQCCGYEIRNGLVGSDPDLVGSDPDLVGSDPELSGSGIIVPDMDLTFLTRKSV